MRLPRNSSRPKSRARVVAQASQLRGTVRNIHSARTLGQKLYCQAIGRAGRDTMSVGTILLLILLGVLPTWGHSREWGYGPSGIVGVIVVILLVLLLI